MFLCRRCGGVGIFSAAAESVAPLQPAPPSLLLPKLLQATLQPTSPIRPRCSLCSSSAHARARARTHGRCWSRSSRTILELVMGLGAGSCERVLVSRRAPNTQASPSQHAQLAYRREERRNLRQWPGCELGQAQVPRDILDEVNTRIQPEVVFLLGVVVTQSQLPGSC